MVAKQILSFYYVPYDRVEVKVFRDYSNAYILAAYGGSHFFVVDFAACDCKVHYKKSLSVVRSLD